VVSAEPGSATIARTHAGSGRRLAVLIGTCTVGFAVVLISTLGRGHAGLLSGVTRRIE
jgi:hypothetical protein